jgi:serine/threonine protein kinase
MEEHITREIKRQSYLNHSHCTSLDGYFHDAHFLYLIMDLLPGTSQEKEEATLEIDHDIVKQVEGLMHLHEESVIHRDIKPESLFMNEVCLSLFRAM